MKKRAYKWRKRKRLSGRAKAGTAQRNAEYNRIKSPKGSGGKSGEHC